MITLSTLFVGLSMLSGAAILYLFLRLRSRVTQVPAKPVMKYFVMTVQRPGKAPETIVDQTIGESRYLAIQHELYSTTVVLWSKEITKDEHAELARVLYKQT